MNKENEYKELLEELNDYIFILNSSEYFDVSKNLNEKKLKITLNYYNRAENIEKGFGEKLFNDCEKNHACLFVDFVSFIKCNLPIKKPKDLDIFIEFDELDKKEYLDIFNNIGNYFSLLNKNNKSDVCDFINCFFDFQEIENIYGSNFIKQIYQNKDSLKTINDYIIENKIKISVENKNFLRFCLEESFIDEIDLLKKSRKENDVEKIILNSKDLKLLSECKYKEKLQIIKNEEKYNYFLNNLNKSNIKYLPSLIDYKTFFNDFKNSNINDNINSVIFSNSYLLNNSFEFFLIENDNIISRIINLSKKGKISFESKEFLAFVENLDKYNSTCKLNSNVLSHIILEFLTSSKKDIIKAMNFMDNKMPESSFSNLLKTISNIFVNTNYNTRNEPFQKINKIYSDYIIEEVSYEYDYDDIKKIQECISNFNNLSQKQIILKKIGPIENKTASKKRKM